MSRGGLGQLTLHLAVSGVSSLLAMPLESALKMLLLGVGSAVPHPPWFLLLGRAELHFKFEGAECQRSCVTKTLLRCNALDAVELIQA